jgi:hypothetical protein
VCSGTGLTHKLSEAEEERWVVGVHGPWGAFASPWCSSSLAQQHYDTVQSERITANAIPGIRDACESLRLFSKPICCESYLSNVVVL